MDVFMKGEGLGWGLCPLLLGIYLLIPCRACTWQDASLWDPASFPVASQLWVMPGFALEPRGSETVLKNKVTYRVMARVPDQPAGTWLKGALWPGDGVGTHRGHAGPTCAWDLAPAGSTELAPIAKRGR